MIFHSLVLLLFFNSWKNIHLSQEGLIEIREDYVEESLLKSESESGKSLSLVFFSAI